MAVWEQIRTLTRCCDAPTRIAYMGDLHGEWQAHVCTACGNPCHTYNVLADPPARKEQS